MSATKSESPASPSAGYLGLARKWRPGRFDDLVGQDAVAQSLARALEGNRLVHGHLLAGPRGVGKTTSARILARAVNCAKGPTANPCGECRHCIDIAAGNDLDVIEIDAASNTGVDNMRELLEGTVRSPFSARFKVYIIDEVHMLSMGAFNALLKTLEEPPAHVIFIFATTELERIPETIRSRCVVHRFRRLATEDIIRRLSEVAEGEGLSLAPDAAREIFTLIAEAVDGGMRDALVAFDQLLALTDGAPTVEAARDLLGLSSQALLAQTLESIADNDAARLLKIVEDLVAQGRNLERFIKGLLAYVHTLMVLQAVPSHTPPAMGGEILQRTRALAERLTQIAVFNLANQLLELEERMKQSAQPRFLVEFTFLRLVAVRPVLPLDQIIDRIQALPASIPSAAAAPADPRPAVPAPAAAPARPYRREAEAPEVRESRPASPPPVAQPARAALAPASALALMDSAPGAPASMDAPAETQELSIAGLSREELIDLIVPALPEAHQFLGRYLKASSAMRANGGTLWVQWPRNDRVGSTMLARPDNRQVLERTVSDLVGRPMRVESSFGEQEVAPAPARVEAGPPQSAAFRDSRPTDDEPAPMPESAFEPAAAESAPAPRVLPRVTAAETQALIRQDGDFARRAKMVRDFFEGTFVDHAGRPIAI